jgi:hypothetical protein
MRGGSLWMTPERRKRLCIALLVATAAAALNFGLDGASKTAQSQAVSTPEETAWPAISQQRPIPKAGPLAEPKSVDQIGFPAELTRQAIPPDNPQTPDKTTLGEKLFFDGRLSADGTVACSTCRSRPLFYRRQAHLDRHQWRRRPAQRAVHPERTLQQDSVLGRKSKNARGSAQRVCRQAAAGECGGDGVCGRDHDNLPGLTLFDSDGEPGEPNKIAREFPFV